MSIPILMLTTDKNSTTVDTDRITIRQNEAGLVIIATLIDADNNAYDLTNCQVAFGENKNGGKMVADGDVEIVDKVGGRIKYKLNTAVYQESGDAWFEITDNTDKLIDTTTNFHIEVVKQADLPVDNENYWSKAEAMLTHVAAFMQKVKNDVNANVAANDDKVTSFITTFQQTLDNYKSELAAYDEKYKELDSNWDAELTKIKTDASTINQQAVTDFKTQRKKLDDDFSAFENSLKTDLSKQLQTIINQIDNLKNHRLPDLQTNVDNLSQKLDQLKVDFNKIDFSDFVTKQDGDLLNKKIESLESQLDNTGKVKSINHVLPDNDGNVLLPIINSINGEKPNKDGAIFLSGIPDPDFYLRNDEVLDFDTMEGTGIYHLDECKCYTSKNPNGLDGFPDNIMYNSEDPKGYKILTGDLLIFSHDIKNINQIVLINNPNLEINLVFAIRSFTVGYIKESPPFKVLHS